MKDMSDAPPYCICGQKALEERSHRGCIESGVLRNIFTDIHGWREYCIENGKRIAPYYATNNFVFPEQYIIKNK